MTVIHPDYIPDMIREMQDDTEVGAVLFDLVINYSNFVGDRERLYKNFTDEDGGFHIEKMERRDTQVLNDLSSKIIQLEKIFEEEYPDLFEKYTSKYPMGMPNFLRDTESLIKNSATVELMPGWYQDKAGNLHKYDGTIWDVVPEVLLNELEYLG